MTIAENKARLDAHSDRLRALEQRIGDNHIMDEERCRDRHTWLDGRMAKVESQVDGLRHRATAILVTVIMLLAGVAANLIVLLTRG